MRRRPQLALAASLALFLAFASAVPSDAPDPAPEAGAAGDRIAWDDTVVATHPGGNVTAAQWRGRLDLAEPWKYHAGEDLRTSARNLLVTEAYERWRASLGDDVLAGPAALVCRWYEIAQAGADARAAFLATPLPEDREPTEEEIAAHYEAKRDDYRLPARARFRYIMIPGHDEAARARAEEVLARLAEEPESFEALAEEHSSSNLVPKGRIVGPATRETMLPDMAGPLFDELEEGDTSGVLELPTGFVIVRLVARTEEQVRELEQVRGGIERTMRFDRMQELHAAERERVRADHPFRLELEEPPAMGEQGGATVLSFGEVVLTVDDLRSFLVFDSRWGGDAASWREAAEAAHDALVDREAFVRLAEGWDAAARFAAIAKEQQAWFREVAGALALTPPTQQQIDEVGAEILERMRQRAEVEGRVVYVRPRDRADSEPRSIVPRTEVLAEIAGLRARIMDGEPIEDVAREASTDAATRASGGLVTTSDEGLPPAVAQVLRRLQPGELSEPIQLADGYALAMPVRVMSSLPSGPSDIDWMAGPSFVRLRAGGFLRGFRSMFQHELAVIDDQATSPYLEAIDAMAAAHREAEGTADAGKAGADLEPDAHPLGLPLDRAGATSGGE